VICNPFAAASPYICSVIFIISSLRISTDSPINWSRFFVSVHRTNLYKTMSSAMSFFVLLAMLVAMAQANPLKSESSCDAQFYETDECWATVSVQRDCKSAKLNLSNSNISKSCSSVDVGWAYPMNNLTVTIETPFTQQRQPYAVIFNNKWLMEALTNVYRVFNNQETEVITHDTTLIQYSDSNYQVILKFQAPSTISAYKVFLNYDVVRM
jgi:hypothetical protein